MTKLEEAQKKSQGKIQAIQTMMKTLNITLMAKQKLSDDGFIENMVVFVDGDKYDTTEEAETKPVEPEVTPETQENA